MTCGVYVIHVLQKFEELAGKGDDLLRFNLSQVKSVVEKAREYGLPIFIEGKSVANSLEELTGENIIRCERDVELFLSDPLPDQRVSEYGLTHLVLFGYAMDACVLSAAEAAVVKGLPFKTAPQVLFTNDLFYDGTGDAKEYFRDNDGWCNSVDELYDFLEQFHQPRPEHTNQQ